jgi:hypothetical protein
VTPTAGASTRGYRGAGWRCERPGRYRELRDEARRLEPGTTHGGDAEPGLDQFRWNLLTMREARNEKLAALHDPSNAQRRAWVAHMRAQGVSDLVVRPPGLRERASFLLFGDPGEGDSSQFALVEPLRARADGVDFVFVASDVVYPAGDVNDYRRKVYFPYRELPQPLYAIPGNHDWDDGGLYGFMFHFCGQDEPPPAVPGAVPRALRRVWRTPVPADPETRRLRDERAAAGGLGRQPGPYFALETGPLLLVGLDLGLCGRIDREQGDWLRSVSLADARPKLLVTSKPIYADGHYTPRRLEGGGTLDEVVRDPRANYIAVVSGEVHNYQRYPVAVGGGRTVQYMVCGAGGAFTQGTHTIARIDIANVDPALPPVREEDVRLYPLRGDSLTFFSELYARRLAEARLAGPLLRRLGLRSEALRIRPEHGERLVAELIGVEPRRDGSAPPSEAERRAARIVRWLPAGHLGELYYPYWDWDEPPFFKCFLRVDATRDEIRFRLFAATGCGEQEADPPLEDELVWRPAGGWDG